MTDTYLLDAIKHSPHPVIIVSQEQRIIAMNTALQQLTGKQETELLGARLQTIGFLSLTNQRLEQLFNKMGQTRAQASTEVYIDGPNDTHVYQCICKKLTSELYAFYFHDVSELKRMAELDALTGVYTRRVFKRELTELLGRVERYKEIFSLLILDLNKFKNINDTYGHAVGDLVLETVGEALRVVSRDTDIPARIGGDEFALLLPQTDASGAQAAAERIKAHLKERLIPTENGSIEVLVSIGCSVCPADGTTKEDLYNKADERMYAEKDQ